MDQVDLDFRVSRLYEMMDWVMGVGDANLKIGRRVGLRSEDLAQLCLAQLGLAQLGLAQLGLAQLGLAQLGLAQLGLAQLGLAQLGLAQLVV